MAITLAINGQSYTGFISAEVSRSFSDASGQFTLITTPTDTNNRPQDAYPIKTGDSCQIMVSGQVFLTGYVEEINISHSATEYNIEIKGRDRTCDLIDSTIDPDVLTSSSGNTTLQKICETVIEKIGIKNLGVINNLGEEIDIADTSFTSGEIIAAMPGQNAFDYLQQYARYKQTILSTDGQGNLTINRTGTELLPVRLLCEVNGTQNNIVRASASLNNTEQYNVYKVYSQKALMFFEFQGTKFAQDSSEPQNSAINQVGTSINKDIRTGRQYVCVTDTPVISAANAINYADWENNYRKAKSFSYQPTIAEHTYDGTNIWTPNTLVTVKDDLSYIQNGYGINSVLLIDGVTFNQDANDGLTTTLNLVYKNSYSLVIEQNYREAVANVVLDAYQTISVGQA